jgi:hypothetical protein
MNFFKKNYLLSFPKNKYLNICLFYMKHHSQAQNDLRIFIAIVHNKRFSLHKKNSKPLEML